MRVLAFDCSTVRGSVAVLEDGRDVFAEAFDCPRGRGGAFFEVLDRAIRSTGKPERIAVGIGPGSYNGLRTAVAAIEGLKLATGAEAVGIISVRALSCDEPEFAVVNDARGSVFYFAKIRERKLVGEFELLTAEALTTRLQAEPGLSVFSAAPLAVVPRATLAFPDASVMARLAEREEAPDRMIEPLYLKPAHITQPKRTGLLPRGK